MPAGRMLKYVFAGAIALGLGGVAVKVRRGRRYGRLQPRVYYNRAGRVEGIEVFGDYVVRQLGLSGDTEIGRRLAKGAEGFLRGDKSGSDDSLEHLFNLISKVCDVSADNKVESVYEELLKELELCLLSYFSFHWDHAPIFLEQIVGAGSGSSKGKLRRAVLSATRQHQIEQVVKTLNMKRVMSTMLEQLKRMGRHPSLPGDKEVMVPVESCSRSPVLLMIGGGMGAGKSTAVKDVMQCPFWAHAGPNAVVVEADAFKETDVVYRALNSLGHIDVAQTAQLVHDSSTQAASSLLVAALNEGRDIIYDGTMSWEPFVVQTIEMARDVHRRKYRLGPGYTKGPDGVVQEKYWEPVDDEDDAESLASEDSSVHGGKQPEDPSPQQSKPYRIELAGVTCEAYLAVVRGMRRAILTGRGVPVGGQLKSHKLFSQSVEKYCELVDHAKIYSTSAVGQPAELIGWKEGTSKLLVDNEAFRAIRQLSTLNQHASSIYELYPGLTDRCGQVQKWKDSLVSAERLQRQVVLRGQLLVYEGSVGRTKTLNAA